MRNTLKIFGIAVSSALLGGAIAVYAQRLNSVEKPSIADPFVEMQNLFHDDFFFSESPIERMRKLSRQMHGGADIFGNESFHEISQREDEKNIYFDISLKGVEGESVKTTVENGYLTISGEVKKVESQNANGSASRSVFSSSFRKSLPLPDGVDVEKMEMENEKDKLILKFPKQSRAT